MIILFAVMSVTAQELYQFNLEELQKLAIDQSPNVNRMMQDSRIANERAKAAFAPDQPWVSYFQEGINYPSSEDFVEARWTISQNINSPVKAYYNYQKNKIASSANRNLAQANQYITKYRLKSAVFSLKSKILEFKAIERRTDLFQRLVDITNLKYENGDIGITELERIKLQYFNSINDMNQLKADVRAIELAVFNLIGINTGRNSILEIEFDLDYSDYMVDNISVNEFRENSRLIAFDENIKSLMQGRKEILSELSPDLSVAYYRQSYMTDFDYYGVDFGVSVPIWFFSGTKRQLEAAEANIKKSEWDLIELERNLRQQYLEAVNNMKISADNIANLEDNIIGSILSIIDNNFQAYEAGEITITDVIQSQMMVAEAEVKYARELNTYFNAIGVIEMISETEIVK